MFPTDVIAALKTAYIDFDVPADQIVADPALSQEFCRRTNLLLPEQSHIASGPDFNRKLLNLRRRGEAKGGLPRIRSQFHGRGGSKA